MRLNEERARLSQRLVTIRHDLPLEHHWHELVSQPIAYDALLKLLDSLELRVHARRFREEALASTELFPDLVLAAGAGAGTAAGAKSPASTPRAPSAGTLPGRDEPEGRPPFGDYRDVADGAALVSLARELADASGPVAFDTETTGLNPLRADLVGISIATAEGRAFYLPVGHVMEPNLDPDRTREAPAGTPSRRRDTSTRACARRFRRCTRWTAWCSRFSPGTSSRTPP